MISAVQNKIFHHFAPHKNLGFSYFIYIHLHTLFTSDLVFGRGFIQCVQLPAEFVQLIIDVVHLGTQALVVP